MVRVSQTVIDGLYEKYGFFDDEGYVVDPSHENVQKMERRLEELSKKTRLTAQEQREAAELVLLDKAYTDEVNRYVLDEAVKQMDAETDSEEDGEYEDDEEEYDSEEVSGESIHTDDSSDE